MKIISDVYVCQFINGSTVIEVNRKVENPERYIEPRLNIVLTKDEFKQLKEKINDL